MCLLACAILFACQALPVTALPGAVEQRFQDHGIRDKEVIRNTLWTARAGYRMEAHNLLVAKGNEMIGVLEGHGMNTTKLQEAIDEYEALGPGLQQAIDENDKSGLQTVNKDLKKAWQGFMRALRTLVKPMAPCEESGVELGS